ncbi:MAG: hypothetical protein PWP74_2067 [Shewanella sp.]|jgi:nucleoside-diphosphate-sugar epimerase|nr:hypothetical protein [Shewanella sp.]
MQQIWQDLHNAGISNDAPMTILKHTYCKMTTERKPVAMAITCMWPPHFLQFPKHEDEMIKPAFERTLRVMRAAQDPGVKRLIMISNFGGVGIAIKIHIT